VTNDAPKFVSQQAVRIFGGLTAVLLLAVLVSDLRSDLRAQWNEGSRRANEVALSAAQMAQAPLHYSANAMMLIAEEARHLHQALPLQNDVLMKGFVAAVLRRQPQISDVTFVDRTSVDGTSASSLATVGLWTSCDANALSAATVPCFGPVETSPNGWVLPLATHIEGQQWVVGGFQVTALERSLATVPYAQTVSFSVVDANGRVVLRGGKAEALALIARQPHVPWWIQRMAGSQALAPLRATVPVGGFPFAVVAETTYQDALAPWHRQAATAMLFYLFYLAAFICLLKVVSRATEVQRHYIRNLQARTADLRLAQRVGRTAMWSLSDDARRFECSENAEELFGLSPGKIVTSAMDFLAVVYPSDRLSLAHHVKHAWRSMAPLRIEFRVRLRNGAVRHLSAGGQVVVDVNGTKRMTGTVVDVTEQWEARQRQKESEHRFDVLFEQNPLPFWVFDSASLRFLEVNAAALRTYGYTREEFLNMTILDIRDPDTRDAVITHAASSWEVRQNPKAWVHRTKDGKAINVKVHSADISFAGCAARLVLAEDVTAHLADERELAYRATHDLVTGLPNQHAFMERMDVLIAGGSTFEVAYLQLIGMDAIADTFGINVATGILQVVASRIAQLTEGRGYFAAITPQAFALMDAGHLTDTLLQAIAVCVTEPLYYKDTQHQLNIVIGVVHHPEDSVQGDALLARAALAAHAHLHSDEPVHHFQPAMAQQSREKLHFAASLRRAVKQHEFELHFQAVTDFPDKRLIGLEALIRWPRGDGTYVMPSTFIPICEESGLIVSLGEWVLSQAAKASRDLRDAGFENLPIAVNVSPAELRSSDLIANIRAVRQAYALTDNALRIELTESSLIEHREKAIAVMKQLRTDGVAVALDDFGTGFSGLSYLRDLPIDTLKIDQGFVRSVDRDARSATICDAIIALGKSLKVGIVAEGIERHSQYRWLHKHGCDGAQGFYLGRPEKLSDLMARWSHAKERVP
jgi:PAS domain S-box-containing protein